MEDVIIIGAGLSGLSAANQLKKEGIKCKILEAQSRIGGRIETIYSNQETPMEMGATWLGQEHINLIQLLSELNIGFFEQHTEGISLFETMSFEPPQQYFVPANSNASFRIKGGSFSMIDALCQQIGKENIILNTEVIGVSEENNQIKIIDSLGNKYFSNHLIIAMPPKVAINNIMFTPNLPDGISQIMGKTQTWMSGSVKFSVEYKKAFWKDNGFSGCVFSHTGLATEIYDHSNYENTKFSLMGFLNGSAYHYTRAERKEKVIAQLKNYFGEEAEKFESYNDKIWEDKYIKANEDSFLPPHFNNGHDVYKDSFMNGKLFFTGTETSNTFSGYMEGAIIASTLISKRVAKKINTCL
jgi:monoamine oxidase